MPIWSEPADAKGAQFGDYTLLTGEDIRGRNRVTDYFHSFWCDLCTDGHQPTRADVRPANMKQYLNRLVLMDVEPRDEEFGLLVRLIGTHVAAFYGEIAGKHIDDMDNPDAIKRIYRSCEKTIKSAEPVLSVTAGIAKNKNHLEGFALYLPLFDESGSVHKIMVAVDIKSLVK